MNLVTKLRAAITSLAVTLSTLGSCFQPDPAESKDVHSLRPEVHAYYLHEQRAALMFAGVGALAAIGGRLLVAAPNAVSRGLGWSSLALGVIEVVVGSIYALSARHRGQALDERFERDASNVVREEGASARTTTEHFPLYLGIELAIALAGAAIAAYGAASHQPTWRGVGMGIMTHGLFMFAFDVVSWRHSAAYAIRFGAAAPGDGV